MRTLLTLAQLLCVRQGEESLLNILITGVFTVCVCVFFVSFGICFTRSPVVVFVMTDMLSSSQSSLSLDVCVGV